MSVLLDTGVVVPFLNADDARHSRALELETRVAHQRFGTPFVTDLVVHELFTLVRGLQVVALGLAGLAPSWEA